MRNPCVAGAVAEKTDAAVAVVMEAATEAVVSRVFDAADTVAEDGEAEAVADTADMEALDLVTGMAMPWIRTKASINLTTTCMLSQIQNTWMRRPCRARRKTK